MHHVINEEAMDNILGTPVYHENSLLTIHCRVYVVLHLSRRVGVSFVGSLPHAIDAVE